MTNPKISIIAPTYNHEKYIKYFIESILAQTEPDFELLIIDDCSADNTCSEVEKFNDNRIKLIRHKYNQGINGVMNTGFDNSSGKYIMFHSCDDMSEKDHLKKTSEYLDTHEDVNTVYCNLFYIDEQNMPREDLNRRYKQIENKPRTEMLHSAFTTGNTVGSPGMLMRRTIFEQLMPRPYALLQYQDYQLNVELLIKGYIYIIPEKLVKYRQPHDGSNISAGSFATKMREELEEDALMNTFLQIKDIDLLERIFVGEIEQTGIKPYTDTIPYFLGRTAMLSHVPTRRTWGYHTILEFLNSPENAAIIKSRYNLVFKDYIGLVKLFENNDIFKIYKKFIKYKKYFNILLVINIITGILLILSVLAIFKVF